MRYRTFGRTGWQVSEIGFGAWQLGGDWGKVNDAHSVDTVHYAFDKGINFVDTAELYGNGHSEEVIGQALKSWKGTKIYVATKVRPIHWPRPEDKIPQMRGRFPEWYIRENVEHSLKRLVDRVYHLPPMIDGSDDFAGIGGPNEGLGFIVGLGEETVDGSLEVGDGSEDTTLQAAAGQLGEVAFDRVESGA